MGKKIEDLNAAVQAARSLKAVKEVVEEFATVDRRRKVTPAIRRAILKWHNKRCTLREMRERLLLEQHVSLSDPTIRKIIRIFEHKENADAAASG
jgi:hypothetical protein